MTNLTEQWKKGELLCGWYWVKMSYQGAIILLYYSEDYGFEYDDHFYDFEEISEVLGRVPNYELWKAVHEQWKVLLEENAQLKKWCEEFNALEVANENTKLKKENKKLCKKIDELYENIDMWVAENAKFRELLEEGNNWLKAFYAYEQSDFVREQVKQCLTKINQVLGEE